MLSGHIAISGELGSGKSVVARRLAEKDGRRVVSTGDIQRSIAASLSLSTLETNWLAERDDMIDSKVDAVTTELGESAEPIIFDSRMAWKMVPKSYKIHLLVDARIAAKRLHGTRSSPVEGYESIDEAQAAAEARYQSERRRFLSTYGVDVSRLRNYDLVVDSSHASVDEVVSVIARAMSESTTTSPSLWVSPRRILPLGEVRPDGVTDVPAVLYVRPCFGAVGVYESISDHIARGSALMRVELLAEEADGSHQDVLVREHFRRAPEAVVKDWCARHGLELPSYGDVIVDR